MCTAITYHGNAFYFGRNLDLEYGYDEKVTITPRNYVFRFRNSEELESHYAIIGIGTIADGYPLYYDAINEKGLAIAGLNFPGNAVYCPFNGKKTNICSFELIPYLLSKCETVSQARQILNHTNIWDAPFSDQFPISPLHWIVADKAEAITIEPLKDGLKIHDNPIGVLTNNPTFDYHMTNLTNFMNLTPNAPENKFSKNINLNPYSLGMGAIGLPGDPSSASRFVRAAFTKLNAISDANDIACITQFFHILDSVAQQKGVTHVKDNEYEITRYTSCCNADTRTYYYTTYENRQICAVNLYADKCSGKALISYPLLTNQNICYQN